LHTYGTAGFYAHTSGVDYVPGYIWVLELLAMLYGPLAAHDPQGRILQSLVRLPAILADTALVAVAVDFARVTKRPPTAAIILAVSPALLLLTSYWGQVDSIAVALLLSAILATLSERISLSWFFFAVAIVIKPQPLVVGPLLMLWQLQRRQFTSLLWAPAMTALLCYIVSLPFTIARGPVAVWSWFLHQYLTGISKYPVASVNAFNLYGLLGRVYTPDSETFCGIALHTWGVGLFGLVLAAVSAKLWYDLRTLTQESDRVQQLMLASTVVLFALFMLTTRMHERYLFAALAMMTIAMRPNDRRWLYLVITLHVVFLINELFTLGGLHDRYMSSAITAAVAFFSLINLVLFAITTWTFFTRNAVEPQAIPEIA
jgi:dolichyl-phosphate-mannose-protein mannosyltransferase